MRNENKANTDLLDELAALKEKVIRLENNELQQYYTLKTITDSFQSAIFSLDVNYCYTSFNSTHAAIMKSLYNSDIQIGKSLLDYQTVAADRVLAKQNIDKVLSGISLKEEAYSGDDNLSRRYFEISHTPICNQANIIIGVAVVANDKTEQKQATEKMIESEARYRLLFEQSPDGIVLLDPHNLKIIEFNEAAHQQLGYTADEFAKLSLQDICLSDIPNQPQQWQLLCNNTESYETKLLTKSGDSRDVHVKGQVIQLLGCEYIHCVWRDITAHKQAEKALRDNERKFRELANSITDVFFALDKNLTYTFWNNASEKLTGIPASKAIGKSIYEIFPDIKGTDIEQTLIDGLAHKKQISLISEYLISNEKLILEITVNPTQTGISVLTKDISERKHAEETVQRLGRYYQALIENAPDGVALIDAEGNFTYISPVALKIFGYAQRDVVSKCPADLTHPDDLPMVLNALQKIITDPNQIECLQYRFMAKSGEWIWIESTFSNLLVEPIIQAIVINFKDITKRLYDETALRESEDRFKAVSEYSHNAICIVNEQARIIWANEALEKLGGYSKEQLYQSESFVQFLAPESAEFVVSNFTKFVLQEEYVHHYNFYFVGADGQKRLCEKYMTHYLDKHGKPSLVISMLDITEKNRIEIALQESEKNLRHIIEALPFGLAIIGTDRRINHVNKMALNLMKYISEDEIVGKNCRVMMCADEEKCPLIDLNQMVDKSERLLVDKNGKRIEILKSAVPVSINNKQVILETFIDISNLKKAERALRESEEKFRIITENSPDTILITDQQGNFRYINSTAYKMLGYTPDELSYKTIFDLLQPGIMEDGYAFFSKIKSDENHFAEIELRARNGNFIPTDFNGVLLPNGLLFSSFRDATFRKQATQELNEYSEDLKKLVWQKTDEIQKINEQLELAMFAGNIAWWDWNYATGKVLFSESKAELLGYSYHEVSTDMYWWTQQIHPDDYDAAQQNMQNALQSDVYTYDVEYRLRTKNDAWKWFHDRGRIISRDDEGKPIRIIGVVYDISERKRAAEKIKQSEERYRLISENMSDVVSLHDNDGNILYTSTSLFDLIGYKPDDLIGQNPIGLIHPDDLEALKQGFVKIMKNKARHPFVKQYRIKHKSGDFFWVESSFNLFHNEANAVLGIQIATRNIAIQKQAEQNILTALQREKELSDLKSEFISITSHEFRTPLTTIHSSMEILNLLLDAVSAERRPSFVKHIERVTHEVQRLTVLITDVLAISKIESGKISFLPEKANLIEFCKNLIDTDFSETSDGRKVDFSYSGIAKDIFLDRKLITRVLANLLSNAFKYSRGKANPKLEIKFASTSVMISVSDSGIGIPKEAKDKLFTTFFRAKNALNFEGTGLGLVIAKKFVELHNGIIHFLSEVGEGTTFYIKLPYNHKRINNNPNMTEEDEKDFSN